MSAIEWLLGIGDFPARWHCGNWSEALGWGHIAADALIALSYFAIPVALMRVKRSLSRIETEAGHGAFAVLSDHMRTVWPTLIRWCKAFVLACGVGHALEPVIFWVPVYRIEFAWKVLVAIVTVADVLRREESNIIKGWGGGD